MEKILFAYNVSDITIARYCSAMNFSFLLINLDERQYDKNIELIKAIQEWIEGPEIILFSEDSSKLQVFNSNLGLNTLLTEQIKNCEFEIHVQNKLTKFTNCKSNQGIGYRTQLIHLQIQPEDILNTEAYIIEMGKELQIGVYNFESLDQILDYIDNFKT